jgi:8-oxo-dGTP diphosphatase
MHIYVLGYRAKSVPPHGLAQRVSPNNLEYKRESGLKKRATVICRRGKRILLVARNQSKWALPGGILKQGEHSAVAALRELKEETRLAGKSAKHLFDFRGKQKHHHVFACEIPNRAKARPSNEIAKCRWVHLDDIARLMTSGPTNNIVKLMSQRRRK